MTEFTPWQPGRLGSLSVLDDLPRSAAASKVQAATRAAVDAEGPTHVVRLAKLVAGAFGLHRGAQSRSAAILRCVPSGLTRDPDEPFIWPSTIDPAVWRAVRTAPAGEPRPPEHISLAEPANAMRIAAEAAAGMNEADLKREALTPVAAASSPRPSAPASTRRSPPASALVA